LNSLLGRTVKGLSARNRRVVSAQTNWIWLTALGLALVSGEGRVAWAAEADSGGDKIQFSGAADAIRLPESDEANARLSGSMELLERGNSLGGALDRPGGLPPATTPRQGLSPRLLERLDREKNWVLSRPEDLTRMPTAEEVMQVWDYDLDRALGVRGAATDRLAAPSATPQVTPWALNPGRSDSAVVLDYQSNMGARLGGGANIGSRLGSSFGVPSTLTTLLPLTPNPPAPETRVNPLGLTTTDLFPASQRKQVTPVIRELLAAPNGLNPLATGFDPINLGTDSTRREINPVTSPSLYDLGAGQRFDTAFSVPTAGASGNSRPSVLEEMTAKILGPSSLSPALPAPAEPPKLKVKPNTRESFGRKL